MKICLISNLYNPYIIGGAEIYVERIANYLSENHEVSVITTEPFKSTESLKPTTVEKDGLKIYSFYPLNVYHTYYAKRTNFLKKPFWHAIDLWNLHSYSIVKSILQKEKPDLVHTHNLGGLSLSTFNAVKRQDLPLIHTIHDYSLLCPKADLLRGSGNVCESPNILCKIYRNLKRKVANSKPDIVTAPSKFALELLKNYSFFKDSESLYMPLGIETKDFPEKKSDEILNLLYAGHLAKNKGIITLISAFRRISNKNLRLDIAGDGPEKENLEEASQEDGRIKFHGFLDSTEMEKLYKKASAVTVPSLWYENSPFVIYESLSHGVPVIGSKIGGIPELIRDGYNGFLFTPGDVSDLKRKIEKLVESNLTKLSQNALNSSKEFEMKKHIEKLLKLYEKISH